MPTDHTMSHISLFGSVHWAAMRCGLSRDTFRKKRPQMETDGFPIPDPITGHYVKADVDAWINRRRQVADELKVVSGSTRKEEINYDAL
jgi:predicted DNA-binding transcriptional regulator AlpA